MVPAIARAYPDHTIIVRPHPSEDHDRWRETPAGIENAKVLYQGSAEPWLWAADAVIHNASTIGVEAFLLDRPVISYMPVVDETFNRRTHLPNVVSTQAHTMEELVRALGTALGDRPMSDAKTSERKDLVGRYIANASGPLAAERIVQVLSDLNAARPAPRRDTLSYLNAWSRMTARQSLSRLRHMVRFDRNLQAYMNQKFPGLSLREVEDTLRAISQAAGHADFVVAPHPDLSGCYMIAAARHEAKRSRVLQPEPAVTT
jgi:CDP-glycerol glycerophosphotransferase (TagB/SpsB family)